MEPKEPPSGAQECADAPHVHNAAERTPQRQEATAPEDASRDQPTGEDAKSERPQDVGNSVAARTVPGTSSSGVAKRPVASSPLKPVTNAAQPLGKDAKRSSTEQGPPLKRPKAASAPAQQRAREAQPKAPVDLIERLKEYVELCGGTLEDGWSVDVRTSPCIRHSPRAVLKLASAGYQIHAGMSSVPAT